METEKLELTYHKLSGSVFFWHALALHAFCIASALRITDISLIFDLVTTLTVSFSFFFFPAIGYLLALKNYPNTASTKQPSLETRFYHVAAWMFLVLGLLLVCSSVFINVLRLIGKIPKELDANPTYNRF